MSERLRAFVAVPLGHEVAREVSALLEDLARTGVDVRWVRPEGLHCTLKFLGLVEKTDLEALSEKLRAPLASVGPFPVRVRGIGAFPSWKNPRVLWLGLEGEPLGRLAEIVETEAASLGFPRETRPFRPHLTLGRFRSQRQWSRAAPVVEEKGRRELGSFTVRDVVVFRSELSREGARYTPLWTIPLGPSTL
ncbi:MAG: RNA 2',3'-cyclic phosphodiesterase [Candidatus Binatia bacterium]|nr:MAG: RNA 2',3'-cyclic phosphodiesterase [Candidatus Binatia bacterium]